MNVKKILLSKILLSLLVSMPSFAIAMEIQASINQEHRVYREAANGLAFERNMAIARVDRNIEYKVKGAKSQMAIDQIYRNRQADIRSIECAYDARLEVLQANRKSAIKLLVWQADCAGVVVHDGEGCLIS